MSEPAQREGFATDAAIKRVAERFGIGLALASQDWAICAADPSRLEEFLRAYESESFTCDEQFVLMEMLLQSFEDAEASASVDAQWTRVAALLRRDAVVHLSSLRYWSAIEGRGGEWSVPARIREL